MNKLIIVLVLVLVLVCVGCENRMAVTALTDQDASGKLLAGYRPAEYAEVGGVFTWTDVEQTDWGPETTGAGFYVTYEASWVIAAEDEPDPAPGPIGWLDGLKTVPYARVDFLDVVNNENFGNLEPTWVAGLRYLLDDEGTFALNTEWIVHSDLDDSTGKIVSGANARF